MSASSSQGIHTLLEAEQEASKIVEQARDYRIEHLKDARNEATKDIAKLQARKNEELVEIQKKSANQTELTQSIAAETQQRLATIKSQFEKNKQEAVNRLIAAVSTVQFD
ncbi:hypothetical protein H4S08_004828 [Coemansia sp. RSA 1365]|nr:hypothetical protein H4S08_004828 [Coemansia sp. RSA 1365]